MGSVKPGRTAEARGFSNLALVWTGKFTVLDIGNREQFFSRTGTESNLHSRSSKLDPYAPAS